jgi:hypothetical protein
MVKSWQERCLVTTGASYMRKQQALWLKHILEHCASPAMSPMQLTAAIGIRSFTVATQSRRSSN